MFYYFCEEKKEHEPTMLTKDSNPSTWETRKIYEFQGSIEKLSKKKKKAIFTNGH